MFSLAGSKATKENNEKETIASRFAFLLLNNAKLHHEKTSSYSIEDL